MCTPVNITTAQLVKLVNAKLVAYGLGAAMQDTTISEDYHHSLGELAYCALITAFFGFLWGAVAGAWSTIFREYASRHVKICSHEVAWFTHQLAQFAEANQMAGQV